jgi:diguanylate cyclase (GGDEF)-like protein
MEASSLTRRVLAPADVRDWAWWKLPWLLRSYVGAVIAGALALGVAEAVHTSWHAADAAKFALLLGCAMVSVAATPRIAYLHGAITRDFITVWVLPVAILLPPVYVIVAPFPLLMLTQWLVFRGLLYRRVFTAAAMSLAYGAASIAFHAFPPSFAGGSVGAGTHALTWTVAVVLCELIGGRGHSALIGLAIKLADPSSRLSDQLSRKALQAEFTESNLGVLITVIVGVNPVLAIFAVPTWLLVRRFMVHDQLLAQSRLDTKTGLLNAATWEREAATEVARAVRTGSPLALALVDIDHFKLVNDTYGHLVGDKTLRAVTDALRSQLRAYDLAGRFGGEEFAILLPHARGVDAMAVAERLRVHIADLSIPVRDDDETGPSVRVTISVGVAALDGDSRELNDMLAAADTALYHAKQTGRNKTHVATATAAQAS